MTYRGLSKGALLKAPLSALILLGAVSAIPNDCMAQDKYVVGPINTVTSDPLSSGSTLAPTLGRIADEQHEEIVVTGKKDNSTIVVTGRKRRRLTAYNEPIVVVANLLKPTREAKRDFDPIARLTKVRRESKRVAAIAFLLSGVDGIISAKCVARGACTELNPIFGKTPSMGRLLGTKGVVGGGLLYDKAGSAENDPYAARSDSYFNLTTNLLVTISSMGTGL